MGVPVSPEVLTCVSKFMFWGKVEVSLALFIHTRRSIPSVHSRYVPRLGPDLRTTLRMGPGPRRVVGSDDDLRVVQNNRVRFAETQGCLQGLWNESLCDTRLRFRENKK